MAATATFVGFSLTVVAVVFHAQLDLAAAARVKMHDVAGVNRARWELTQVYGEEATIDGDGSFDLNDPADFIRKVLRAHPQQREAGDVEELISVVTHLIMMERSSPDAPTLTCDQATLFLWLVTKWRIDAEWSTSADTEAVASLKDCTSSYEADSTCRALKDFASKCGASAEELKQERGAIFRQYQPAYYPPCIPEAVVHEVHRDKASKCEDAAKAGACPGDEGEADSFMAQYCYATKPSSRCCCREEDVEVQGMFSKLKMGTSKCVSNFLVAPGVEAPSVEAPSVEESSDEELSDDDAAAE